MTPDLEIWLQRATHGLSEVSVAQVRVEIQEHYRAASEVAMEGGASPDNAGRMALSALGNAKISNREYRRVLLTAPEARLLDQSKLWAWSNPRYQPLFWAASLLMLLGSAATFYSGAAWMGFGELASSLFIGFNFLAPRLPIYTPSRARVARYFRWTVQSSMPLTALGPCSQSNMLTFWMVVFCGMVIPSMGFFLWMEWQRASIRRKLPVADWPRQLYL